MKSKSGRLCIDTLLFLPMILSFSGCHYLATKNQVLASSESKRIAMNLTVMNMDAGWQQQVLQPTDSDRIDRLSALIRQSYPDIVGLQRLDRQAASLLLQRLPGYNAVGQDPSDGSEGLIFFRQDRFELNGEKSGWQYRAPNAFAQHLNEKSTGKSLFIGQAAWHGAAAVDEAESLAELFDHMREHRRIDEMLLVLGHWQASSMGHLSRDWLDAFSEAFPQATAGARLATGLAVEDFILCERSSCEVATAEILHVGDEGLHPFEMWPIVGELRLFAQSEGSAWRLARMVGLDALAIGEEE